MGALRIVGVCLFVALSSAGLLLLDVWPWHPTSGWGWLLFVGLALPISVLGQLLGDKVLNNPFSRSVERATSRSAFSWLRIAYLLVMLILMIGAFVTVLHLWRH